MNTIDIIPAIDLIDGQCVRLTQGDYRSKKHYSSDPLQVAKSYEDIGIKRLHLVDLDGAKQKAPQNLHVLERIAGHTALDIQYGGGIKSDESAAAVFNSGARRIICGSMAVTDPERFKRWLTVYSPCSVILGADVRNGKIATHGWLQSAAVDISELLAAFIPAGLSQVICTDISKDGMLEGPSFDLYETLHAAFPGLEITASGGVTNLHDIVRLQQTGMAGVVVGKALYEERITLAELSGFITKQ